MVRVVLEVREGGICRGPCITVGIVECYHGDLVAAPDQQAADGCE